MEEGHVVPECIRGRRKAEEEMHPSCLVPMYKPVGAVLGLLQLDRSMFSNVICRKNEVSRLPEYTEWPGHSINGFYSLTAQEYSRITMPRLIRLKEWFMAHEESFYTWIGHHRYLTFTSLKVFGLCCWRRHYRVSCLQYKISTKNECNSGRN